MEQLTRLRGFGGLGAGTNRCRANMAHIRQSGPDYGLGFQVKFRKTFELFRIHGSGSEIRGSEFRVHGSGFRVQGSGFRVQGFGSGRAPQLSLMVELRQARNLPRAPRGSRGGPVPWSHF